MERPDPFSQRRSTALPAVARRSGHAGGRQAESFTLGASDHLRRPVARERLPASLPKRMPNRGASPILIVEDDEATMEGLARILESEGIAARRSRDELVESVRTFAAHAADSRQSARKGN